LKSKRFLAVKSIVIGLLILLSSTFSQLNAEVFRTGDEQTTTLLEQADQLARQRKYGQALKVYDDVMAGAKKEGDWETLIYALAGKGYAFSGLRNFELAKPSLDSAVLIGKSKGPNGLALASAHYALGIFYTRSNELDKALQAHDQSLRTRLNLLGQRHEKVIESYNGIGEIYRYYIRDFLKAERYFQLALNSLKGLDKTDTRLLYRTYYNLATTKRSLKDFDQALAYGFKAIEALESDNVQDTISLVRCFGMIANIYDNRSQSKRAIEYYKKSLSFRASMRHPSYSELAHDYYNLGVAFITSNDPKSAIACADSMIVLINNHVPNDTRRLADAYIIKAGGLNKLSLFEGSLQNYRYALKIQQSDENTSHFALSYTYKYLADLMLGNQWFDSALHYSQNSIQVATSAGNLENWSNPSYQILEERAYLYEVIASKGKALMALFTQSNQLTQLKLALECFQLSESLMNAYWNSQEVEMSKLQLMQKSYFIYEAAIECSYLLFTESGDSQYLKTAYFLMERSKSRLLSERLEQVKNYSHYNIPDSILKKERKLRSEIALLQNRRYILGENHKNDSVERSVSMQILSLNEQFSEWQDDLITMFPEYRFREPDLGIFPFEKIHREEGSLFVEYFFGETSMYVLTTTPNKTNLVKIQNDTTLTDQINELSKIIAKGPRPESLIDDFKKYSDLAYNLYSKLLLPVLKDLEPKQKPTKLFIVPDGPLNLLPFHALITSKPADTSVPNYKDLDYVARKYIVSYAHDAAAHFTPRLKNSKTGLLAFGWSNEEQETQELINLPGTIKEINLIADIMAGEFIADQDVLKATFMTKAPKYGIIHLAIHGGASQNDMYTNFLQFKDEKLFAYELYNLNLDNDLTVLSACETGYGKIFSSEGVYSMARGFSFAGCKSVLLTLWRINDHSTAMIMGKTYEEIDKGIPLNTAIHEAQIHYLNSADQYSAHPVNWAGMELWGSPESIERTPQGMAYIYYTIASLGCLFLLYLVFRIKPMRSGAK